MKHCPKCRAEYEDPARECMDCHLALQAEPSPPLLAPPDEKLVAVHAFGGPTAAIEAGQARSWLESEGIPCILSGEYSVRILPVPEIRCSLLVREEDAAKAVVILKRYMR